MIAVLADEEEKELGARIRSELLPFLRGLTTAQILATSKKEVRKHLESELKLVLKPHKTLVNSVVESVLLEMMSDRREEAATASLAQQKHNPNNPNKSDGGNGGGALLRVDDHSEDDDVQIISPPAPSDSVPVPTSHKNTLPPPSHRAHSGSSGDADEDDDDDLVIEGTRGSFALIDFPHARYNCAVHKFSAQTYEDYCMNCFVSYVTLWLPRARNGEHIV